MPVGASQKLEIQPILRTLERLNIRITERFPGAHLAEVGEKLHAVADDTNEKIEWIKRPLWWPRILTGFLIFVGLLGLIYGIQHLDFSIRPQFADLMGVAEASINNILLIGAALFFLVGLEKRVKQTLAIKYLNELRAIAHIVDMHQLTKDPTRVVAKLRAKLGDLGDTEHSPKRTLTAFELQRYLTYCSEMLSLIGKVAALYAQSLPEDVVVRTANEIESLCANMSQKIWQKLMILNIELEGSSN